MQPPSNFEKDTWDKLRAAIRAVHAKQAVGHSLEELYRAVEDMCLQGLAATVYDRLRSECEEHIEAKVEALLGQTPDVLAFLTLVQACWADHSEQMLTLRSIFLYLDRTYVMQVTARLGSNITLLLLAMHAPTHARARAHAHAHAHAHVHSQTLRVGSCWTGSNQKVALGYGVADLPHSLEQTSGGRAQGGAGAACAHREREIGRPGVLPSLPTSATISLTVPAPP